MIYVDTLILGAGPTGLGAAWRLHEAGENGWMMLDAADVPGGMSASETDASGFTWDLGGHVIHSHFPYFNAVIGRIQEWSHPRRSGWVRVGDTFVPTPIQHHLGSLPDGLGPAILAELTDLTDWTDLNSPPARTLRDHFLRAFGPLLSEVFFDPYNTKMWAHPPSALEHGWTSLRSGSAARNVPAPALTLESVTHPDDTSPFPYPRFGTGAMWSAIASLLPASQQRYGATVIGVDLARREVTTSDGTCYRYRTCVSSLPLNQLLTMLTDRPDLTAQAPRLLHSSVHAVGLGYGGDIPAQLDGVSWVYSPDREDPFYRSTVLSNYSPAIAGPGRWSILHEVGASAHRPVNAATVGAQCLASMRRWGIADTPVSVWQRYLPLGYPAPFLGRDALLDPLLSALEAHGLRSRGRFGGWRYESSNQDHAFMQGVEAVDADRHGAPEDIFWSERPRPIIDLRSARHASSLPSPSADAVSA